jgi:lipid A oxidase
MPMFKRLFVSTAAALVPLLVNTPVLAEVSVSAYGGFSLSPDSTVTVNNGPSDWSDTIAWDGASFNMPPYYGVRGTWWLNSFDMPQWGVALDFNHNKVKSTKASRPGAVDTLEFTDGINYLTVNALYRFQNETALTPYIGLGAGASIPHVEYQEAGGPKTFEYQFAGGVVAAMAGADVKITDYISAFTEYRATMSWNNADLNGGGSLKANIFSHHFMLGVTVSFGK